MSNTARHLCHGTAMKAACDITIDSWIDLFRFCLRHEQSIRSPRPTDTASCERFGLSSREPSGHTVPTVGSHTQHNFSSDGNTEPAPCCCGNFSDTCVKRVVDILGGLRLSRKLVRASPDATDGQNERVHFCCRLPLYASLHRTTLQAWPILLHADSSTTWRQLSNAI
ncbi:uncharacterized protein LOC110827236 [Zootermopsis nevadensis]|uniref:uncharacterized protein LOC110827236 n=1 Tax=Zootermopsis nevadensis TaxID=136037 RepID=UPI000B8EA65C|nr:uncharacterized protein LOC110827236 [Zootermopsis nevadensis]